MYFMGCARASRGSCREESFPRWQSELFGSEPVAIAVDLYRHETRSTLFTESVLRVEGRLQRCLPLGTPALLNHGQSSHTRSR